MGSSSDAKEREIRFALDSLLPHLGIPGSRYYWVTRCPITGISRRFVLRGKQDEKTYWLNGELFLDLERCLIERAPVASPILRPSHSSLF